MCTAAAKIELERQQLPFWTAEPGVQLRTSECISEIIHEEIHLFTYAGAVIGPGFCAAPGCDDAVMTGKRVSFSAA